MVFLKIYFRFHIKYLYLPLVFIRVSISSEVAETQSTMQQPPDWVLASWPTPNYDNPETHGLKNVILNIVLYTILCCFMSLRIWTRTKLKASFGADDIMILCAMVCLHITWASRTSGEVWRNTFYR